MFDIQFLQRFAEGAEINPGRFSGHTARDFEVKRQRSAARRRAECEQLAADGKTVPLPKALRQKISKACTGRTMAEKAREVIEHCNAAKARMVAVGEVTYNSVRECARAQGISPQLVYKRIASKTERFKEWRFA